MSTESSTDSHPSTPSDAPSVELPTDKELVLKVIPMPGDCNANGDITGAGIPALKWAKLDLKMLFSLIAQCRAKARGKKCYRRANVRWGVVELEPIDNDAVKPVFSDGHESGIFSWDYLYHLGAEQDHLWAGYNRRLQAAGANRDAPMVTASASSCGSH